MDKFDKEKVKKKKRPPGMINWEGIDPISSISKLIRWRSSYSKKNSIGSSDGTYIQYECDSDMYFKALSAEKYLEKIKTHVIDITEELKSNRSSWKTKLIFGGFLNMIMVIKKAETEIFIRNINEKTIILATGSDVFADDIINPS